MCLRSWVGGGGVSLHRTGSSPLAITWYVHIYTSSVPAGSNILCSLAQGRVLAGRSDTCQKVHLHFLWPLIYLPESTPVPFYSYLFLDLMLRALAASLLVIMASSVDRYLLRRRFVSANFMPSGPDQSALLRSPVLFNSKKIKNKN